MNAIKMIKGRMAELDTLVCAGIDPNLQRMPKEIVSQKKTDEEKIGQFLTEYIRIVSPHVCAFKVQKAYFDSLDGGHQLLADVIKMAHDHDAPVIVDGKVGDIDETMKEYMRNIFDLLDADGIVVNPYMGDDVLEPFAKLKDKAVVVLVKTSNPGGSVVQDLQMASGRMLWEEILMMVRQRWNSAGNMIPVVASTQTIDGSHIRSVLGEDGLIFFAGSGAQGGSLDALKTLVNTEGRGVLVNSSRALMYPASQKGESWQEAIQSAVRNFQHELNAARS